MSFKSDIAVSVEHLSKSYTIAHNAVRHDSLGEMIASRVRNPWRASSEKETFWALKDVSFEIKKGDSVGIIGRNGAGKSTLLKVLSRITEPTEGRAVMKGRIGSLLEVGTGFHPDLTGRENVFLNGTILGMARSEIARQFGAIVDFSGTEKFLDTPVKRYSSGMYVRLAFAIAAHLNPEILIVDEVLAVGDAAFQKKCIDKIRDVTNSGKTVLLVSHNPALVRQLCTRSAYFRSGRLLSMGDTSQVLSEYLSSDELETQASEKNKFGMRLIHATLYDSKNEPTNHLVFGQDYYIEATVEAEEKMSSVALIVRIFDDSDNLVSSMCTPEEGLDWFPLQGELSFRVSLPHIQLMPRRYRIDIIVAERDDFYGTVLEVNGAIKIEVQGAYLPGANIFYRAEHGIIRLIDTFEMRHS